MLPYEILVGLRGTMCTCARGFAVKQNSLKQLNSQVRSLYNFTNVLTRSTSRIQLKYEYGDRYINTVKRFHTNLSINNYQASQNGSKLSEANILQENKSNLDNKDDSLNTAEQFSNNVQDHSTFANSINSIPNNVREWLFSESCHVPNKEIEKKFPVSKVALHNIYTIVENETKISHPLTKSIKSINNRKKVNWSVTYNIKWPEEKSFTTVAHMKSVASESAALKCLYWLHLNKKIRNRAPVIYENQERINLLKSPEELELDENILNSMNNFIEKYGIKIHEALNNHEIEEYKGKHSHFTLLNSHPVSYIKIDKNLRNANLTDRLMSRNQISSPELPIHQYKSKILKELEENQALVIKGDTGCGKTTQVPQFIIDYMTENGVGADCSMVVTQPRRISAISLAERIAYERSEEVGDVVGYQVRLQQKLPKQNGGILFCTTGILLKKIQGNPNLNGCSHVIVDEAHERSIDTDMLLVLLRRAIQNNPSLKVIIMSATINADLFQEYMNCNSIDVPGRMFPVKMHLMDDMLKLNIPFHQTLNVIENEEEPIVKCDQITDLIRWIHHEKPPGAILCFLPGWGHINRAQMILEESGRNHFEVITLHSKIPYLNQSKVFQPPPEGKRKVILATDIAETGITVPDVVYVIDSVCHKEVRWHENKGLSSIDTHWISKANLNQRKGRAGRVQEGESYHFITKKKYKELDAYPLPEVLRVSLDKTVLDCKTYSDEKVGDFLGSMPQPPRQSSVKKAVQDLQILGALDNVENLTALGRRIALFSIHPRLSKALVYSSVFQCLNPVATVAAALSMESDLFYGSLDNKSRIRNTKIRFHPTSDHLAISWIHAQWQSFYSQGRQSAYSFCKQNGLHAERMFILDKIREINLEHLREVNMISDVRDATNLNSEWNEFSVLDELVRGVLLAGMDQILKHRNFEFKRGRLTKAGTSMVTEDDAKAQLTPECVNHKRKSWPSPYLIYYQKTHHEERRTTLIRESSIISPVTALLFSQGRITGTKYHDNQSDDKILLVVSGKENIRLVCNKKTAQTILNFRDIMWSVIQYFIENDSQGGLFDDGDNDTTLLFNKYKQEMLRTLGTLLVSVSEKIDSAEESSDDF